jgi:hypothetical protein
MNVVVILNKHELLYIPNLCIHINFMMRMEAMEDKSHYGHSVHFFIEPGQIRPGVLVRLTFDDLTRVVSEHRQDLMSQDLEMKASLNDVFSGLGEATSGGQVTTCRS